MPPLSKKRKACLASAVKGCEARKAQRIPVPDDNSGIELYFDSEEEDSELQRTMQAYREGCQYGIRTVEFKDRVYKSHRRTHVLNGD